MIKKTWCSLFTPSSHLWETSNCEAERYFHVLVEELVAVHPSEGSFAIPNFLAVGHSLAEKCATSCAERAFCPSWYHHRRVERIPGLHQGTT